MELATDAKKFALEYHRDFISLNKLTHSHPELFNFLVSLIGTDQAGRLICNQDSSFDKLRFLPDGASGFVCLNLLNSVRRINKYLEKFNHSMDFGQFIVVKMETNHRRSLRIRNRFPAPFYYPVFALDFLCNRALPKFYVTKRLYFEITKGKYRGISLPEGMARLFACGFDILDYRLIGNDTYILATKINEPAYNLTPTYGLLVKLKRIGQHGDIINVFKIRTMHPFSEYLQEYLYKKNGTKDGDKIEDDFRVTSWGKFIRRFWIDEWPMLWNWLKRDLKLVGVRPLSEHKFNTYPKHLQILRTQYKPGMIPPYYADLPQHVEQFYESEEKYLNAYEKNPIRTDLKYFFKALHNILLKGVRSR